MDSKKTSFEIAKRLKSLRLEKGLSHNRLSQELFRKYGNSDSPVSNPPNQEANKPHSGRSGSLISKDSLISYEVDTENHSKTFKNMGMSVKNLLYLADYYGVSTDYILGRTEAKSTETGVQAIHSSTVLAESSAKTLTKLQEHPPSVNFLDDLLTDQTTLADIAEKYIMYLTIKHAISPVTEKYKNELANMTIYLDTIMQDKNTLPRVKVQDALDYARFELWRSVLNFVDTTHK